MIHLNSDQARAWILDIHKNLSTFRKNNSLTKEEKLFYLSEQYATLSQLARAIDGKVRFVGVPMPSYSER